MASESVADSFAEFKEEAHSLGLMGMDFTSYTQEWAREEVVS